MSGIAGKKQTFVAPAMTVEDLSRALYEANKELMAVNARLRESERRRLEIWANLSHDFRSPLATIKNNIDYLLECVTTHDEETRLVLDNTHAKVRMLEYFLDEMLAVSILDTTNDGQFTLAKERVDIDGMLRGFLESCTNDMRYKDCTLSLDIPKNFSYQADIDRNLIIRVLENLFTNALKYAGPSCGITLGAWYDGGMVGIFVADTGEGVADSERERIFDRTYMVSGARTSGRMPGCGLGLSIARSVVAKHGGSIWCESKADVGSVFTFTLPVS